MFADDFFQMGRTWEPWRELARLQEEVNRLFSGVREQRTLRYPWMTAWTNDEGVFLKAALPGYSLDDVDVAVQSDTLTLSGKRQPVSLPEGANYHRRERSFGQFSRTLQLPFRVEVDKVQAHFKDGVLELMLPRASADLPRKIKVKAH